MLGHFIVEDHERSTQWFKDWSQLLKYMRTRCPCKPNGTFVSREKRAESLAESIDGSFALDFQEEDPRRFQQQLEAMMHAGEPEKFLARPLLDPSTSS